MTLGFVHACEQNHRNLSVIGGGKVVQLATGKVVTSQLDPLWVFNFAFAFGVGGAFDLDGAARAFRQAGRDYVHVLASPSSHAGLPDELAGLGFRLQEHAGADGAGVFLLFDSGPTTQLLHLGVAAAAGWVLDHTADDWLLPLDASREDG